MRQLTAAAPLNTIHQYHFSESSSTQRRVSRPQQNLLVASSFARRNAIRRVGPKLGHNRLEVELQMAVVYEHVVSLNEWPNISRNFDDGRPSLSEPGTGGLDIGRRMRVMLDQA